MSGMSIVSSYDKAFDFSRGLFTSESISPQKTAGERKTSARKINKALPDKQESAGSDDHVAPPTGIHGDRRRLAARVRQRHAACQKAAVG